MIHGPFTPPSISCLPLPEFRHGDLAAARTAFAGATPLALGQAWLNRPDPDFAPGLVRTGWRGEALLVLAELRDRDIFTEARHHNARFWELGDTFELFLQPAGGAPYVELHVTPNNLRLQLRFPAPPTAADPDPFGAALIADDVFESRTWVEAAEDTWWVLADIPAAVVTGPAAGDGKPARAFHGQAWRFSFARYDYTRGRTEPVISSSSPHTRPAFHRPHEWGTLQF